jgi:sec-independent protein translocase protein TatA
MLGNFGMTEILMLLVLCLLLFGAKRLPEIGASIGKGIREFKRGVSDLGSEPAESHAPAMPRHAISHDARHRLRGDPSASTPA